LNIVIDTNILLRFILADDEDQYQATLRLIEAAKSITIPTIVFCETVWVLKNYKIDRDTIIEQIRTIAQSEKIFVADDEVAAGLDLMESGGDFADGVVAYVGRKLSPGGTAVFSSFDKTTVRLLSQRGHSAFVPS